MVDRNTDLIEVGNLNEPGHYESEQRVYSERGGGPTVTTNHAPMVECSNVIIEDGLSPTVVGAGGTGSKIKIEDGFVFRTERNEFGKQIRKQYENGMDVKWTDMKNMVPRTDGVTNTLTGVVKDNVLGVYMNENQNEQELGQNLRIRYLTPRECLRLQAFPDDAIDRLEKVLSKSALYKVAGNSIAVCCLKAIFKGIYVDRTFKKDRQSSLDMFF